MVLQQLVRGGVAKRRRGRPRKDQQGGTSSAQLGTPSSLSHAARDLDTPGQSDTEGGLRSAPTAQRSRLANTASAPDLPSGEAVLLPSGEENVDFADVPVVPPLDIISEERNLPPRHVQQMLALLENLEAQNLEMKAQLGEQRTLLEISIESSSSTREEVSQLAETLGGVIEAIRDEPTSQHRSGANENNFLHDLGSRDPAKVAKTLFNSGKANAIHLLALRASSSSSGYIVSSNNAEFFMPIARELVNARSNLLVNFGDEAENARFKESVVQHLIGKSLPQIFVNEVRRPVIHKFKELVPCDEQGHHNNYNQANFQNVSLQSPLDAEYRVENGDPYGQASYLRLLEEMSRSFYPTERMRTVHATRAPADSMTPNMLAFVEFLMVQTILGERRNLGRAMTSRRNADLYTTLRADTLSRNSVHVTVLDVKQLGNDLDY